MELDKIVELVKERLLEKDGVPVEASGRHIHLGHEDAEKLFGEGYQFNILKELSQPGQFAYKERVRLIGPKGVIEGAIILGPCRKNTQVELSVTDCRILGIKPILRDSGDISGTPGLIITNGDNLIQLKEGIIVAKKHLHMTSQDGEKFGIRDKELVDIKVIGERPLIFQNVLVRINDSFKLSMHIDHDEANACMLNSGSKGIIIKK
ncbi:MAG: phosphate propanoyltransferase [Fusobacteriaceae bacterium]